MKPNGFVLIICASVYLGWTTGNVKGGGMAKFKIEDFYQCEEVAVHKLKFFMHPRDFNGGVQMVDINMSLPFSIGNDATAKVLFELNSDLITKHSWTHLFDLEDDCCKMIDRYVGEFWYDIERQMGIMPHSCPLPRGTYHAVNSRMDYQKMKLQTFPFGKIRITVQVFVKARPDIEGCAKIIVSNTA